jgi:hypothetical protein
MTSALWGVHVCGIPGFKVFLHIKKSQINMTFNPLQARGALIGAIVADAATMVSTFDLSS